MKNITLTPSALSPTGSLWCHIEAQGYYIGSNGHSISSLEQFARLGYEIAAISYKELGFNDGDEPTLEEIQQKAVALGWSFYCPFSHGHYQEGFKPFMTATNGSSLNSVLTRDGHLPTTRLNVVHSDWEVIICRLPAKAQEAVA